MTTGTDLGSMKLYYQVDRVFRELEARGVGPEDPIDPDLLFEFDQYHCLGTDAVDEAAAHLGLDRDMKVLEVGSGIGGPSRYLAHRYGCAMSAVEIQPNVDAVARSLTARCGLEERVSHVLGDVLEGVPGRDFDALVSWLAFLHIPDRPRLYARCFEALRPGAGLYVEDYYTRGALTETEHQSLARDVHCERVPSIDDYRAELAVAGFERFDFTDVSDAWTGWLQARLRDFRATRARHLDLHGSDVVEALDDFYEVMVVLFEGGNLGGLRFVANKPA